MGDNRSPERVVREADELIEKHIDTEIFVILGYSVDSEGILTVHLKERKKKK
jgi:hypothetical protein